MQAPGERRPGGAKERSWRRKKQEGTVVLDRGCLRKHGTWVKERASEIARGSPSRLYPHKDCHALERGSPERGRERAVEPVRSEWGRGGRTLRFQKSRVRSAASVPSVVKGDRERSPRGGESAPWALEERGKPAWERLGQGSERPRERRGGASGWWRSSESVR